MMRRDDLPELEFHYKTFLDRTSIFLGGSGTGKSTVMVHTMYNIRDHVDQVIVISPTDRQNHTYDRGLVPLPCIHYSITEELLTNIWERQEALVSVMTQANNPEILQALFDKIPSSDRFKMAVGEVKQKLNDFKAEMKRSGGDNSNKIQDMEAECNKLITMMIKQSIVKNEAALKQLKLTDQEKFTIKFATLNPRLLLIFDDCTAELKRMKKHPVIQKIFYQGRWAYITCLIACHTDKALDPELKKNAFVTMFTDIPSANAYFSRGSNDLTREDQRKAREALMAAFTPTERFQKLAYVREEGAFKKFIAQRHDNFQFGSQHVWNYCETIKAEPGTAAANNRFMHGFGAK